MPQTLIARPNEDPDEIKIRLLMQDKMFAFRFVCAWLERYGYRLTRIDASPCDLPAGSAGSRPAQSPADAADPEPEYVPLIE